MNWHNINNKIFLSETEDTLCHRVLHSCFIVLFFFIIYPYCSNKLSSYFYTNNSNPVGIIFADTTKVVTLKMKLVYNADIDNSGRVDGRDLAILMYYYGKNEYDSAQYKDINGNNKFDENDIKILENHFGLAK